MSNKKLPTTSGGCDCCGGAVAIGLQPGSGSSGLGQRIIVRSKPKITIGNIIKEYNEGGVIVYELDDQILVLPTVALSNNAPAISEVGQTLASVIFSGQITPGSNAVTTRSINPDPGGLDLTAAFTFEKTNVKRTTPGVAELHTLTAIDADGNSKSKQSSISFKHAFYQGFETGGILNETQIKALANKTLNDSIIQQYGGDQDYVVPSSPATPKYVYWCGPVGTQAIAGAVLNGLALPLIDLAPVNVTNIHDGTLVIPYWVKRTANLLDPGTYKITLS